MRTGLNTIQQTLTTEAATVLTQSIADAGRRNHTQTTPLHVANTLLSSPSGFLRQACIRSHPNSSHPLQCRALELCFSVALDRLPAATSSPATTDPPVSNALMAALKRAQAHQRRGCPENQQQPLLAVKVELEQLIVSILDDPSVSRVMREASFSSPAVKATIEQSLIKPGISPVSGSGSVNRNLYLNPRLLQQKQGNETGEGAALSKPLSRPGVSPVSGNLYLNPRLLQQKQGNETGEGRVCEEVNRVIEIMGKEKRKNPILVGESEPETIRKQILQRVESGEFVINKELRKIDVISISISLDGLLNLKKIKELGGFIEERIVGFDGGKGVVVDLGDLKWLVGTVMGSSGRESVAEMGRLVEKFAGKVWLIGTATCETFLRCQVYYPSMESDWDLQAVPITSRSPFPNMLPRMVTNGVLGGSVQSFNPLNSMSTNMNLDPGRKIPICPKCSSDYEQEVEKLKQLEKPSGEVKNSLPQWLQNATTKEQSQNKDQELVLKLKIEELQKKWRDECFRIHPNYNQSSRLDRVVPMVVPLTGAYKPNMLLQQSKTGQQPRLEPPRSPVGTDLVLGPKKPSETTVPKDDQNLAVKDLLGCISSEPQKGKFVNSSDTDYFKKLLKGLMKQCWWQPEAASAIATTITQCKVDTGSRGCVWLLFAGPDRVGKKKMASVLSEHITGTNPITIGLGSKRDYDETDTGFRGKTVLDRIVDAVRRNPSSVIVLSDIDEADMLVRGSIKRAMERGRLTDSYGREISLGNVVFVVTGNWSTANNPNADEQRLHAIATRDWQLKLTISEKRLKRKANWLLGNNKSTKPRKEPGLDLSLDLNLGMIDYEEDRTDGSIGSINSSNLTIDNEIEDQQFAVSVPHDLLRPSDAAVVFKPVDFGSLRVEIEKTIRNAFSTIVDRVDRVDRVTTFEVEEGAVEDILGGLWFGRVSLEEWAEQVLVPSLHQVNSRLPNRGEDLVVRLESDRDRVRVCIGENWLPGEIEVVVDGV